MDDPNIELLMRVADKGFLNALPGLIIEGSPAVRLPVVLQRLRTIAA